MASSSSTGKSYNESVFSFSSLCILFQTQAKALVPPFLATVLLTSMPNGEARSVWFPRQTFTGSFQEFLVSWRLMSAVTTALSSSTLSTLAIGTQSTTALPASAVHLSVLFIQPVFLALICLFQRHWNLETSRRPASSYFCEACSHLTTPGNLLTTCSFVWVHLDIQFLSSTLISSSLSFMAAILCNKYLALPLHSCFQLQLP